MLRKFGADIVMIQETKKSSVIENVLTRYGEAEIKTGLSMCPKVQLEE